MEPGKKARKGKKPIVSDLAQHKSKEPEDLLTDTSRLKHPEVASKEREYLGDRVRRARESRGLTLEDLGSRVGISPDILRRVESNKEVPPLGELVKLGKALEMRMGYFISPGVEKPLTIVRASERRPVSRHDEKTSKRHGYSYESLAPEKANRTMEPFLVTLLPTEVEEFSTHDGQEFIFVLEGKMKVQVKDEVEFLQAGDALYYDSTQPHFVRCVGNKETKILAVIYPGPR